MATSNLSLPTPNASRPTLASWPNQNQPQQPPSPWPGQELPQPQVQPQLRVSSWPSYDVPQQGQSAWPSQPAPQQGQSSWSSQPAPQQGQSSWPSQAVPQQALSMPEPWVEPMAEPALRRKPKGNRGMIAWSLCVFAGGLAAAAPLAELADQGMAAGIAWVATWAPSFLRPYLPTPIEESVPVPSRAKASPTPAAAPSAVVPVARVERRTTAPQITVQPVQPKALADVAKPKATAPERTAPAAHSRATHGTRGKATATVALAEPPAPAPAPAAKPTTKKRLEGSDPFAGEIDGVADPATERPAKVASQPASAKSSPGKSGDALDDLMAGVASGSGKPHAKHSTSREIDAMLKDVQKAEPAPSKPKPTEPASLPSLTASDIATAMASVKSGASACGKRFGQDGAVDLGMTVGKDGKVTNVAVRGKLADSPVAQCVAKAARGASFPRNSGLKFDYRLNLQ